MAPGGWRTAEQKHFFELWMPEFLIKKGAHELEGFWRKMKEAWFAEFPEELCLGLPVQDFDPDPNAARPRKLTPEESKQLAVAMARREKQLHNSFNNRFAKIRAERGGISRSSASMAAMLFKSRPKRRRRHQVLEVYQMECKETVKKGLKNSEYDSLNEASQCRDAEGDWIDDDDDEAKVKRISQTRKARMKVKRRVVQELWDDEPEELKERIREMAKKEIVELAPDTESGDGEAAERTPEEYQMSLDESMQVAEMFLHEFKRMTGWVGVLVYAGPVPRLGGEMGIKSVCFGDTPGNVNFEDWHPQWKKAVTNPLFKFARQAIPRDVRVARAIVTAEDDDEPDDPEAAMPKKSKKKAGTKISAPAASTAASTPKPARRPRPCPTAAASNSAPSRSPSTAPATTDASVTLHDSSDSNTLALATPDASVAPEYPTDDDPMAGGDTTISYQDYETTQLETTEHQDVLGDLAQDGVSQSGGALWEHSLRLPDGYEYGNVLDVPQLGTLHSGALDALHSGALDALHSGALSVLPSEDFSAFEPSVFDGYENNYQTGYQGDSDGGFSQIDDGSASSYPDPFLGTRTDNNRSIFGVQATIDEGSLWTLRPTPRPVSSASDMFIFGREGRFRDDMWSAGTGTSSTGTTGGAPHSADHGGRGPSSSSSPLESLLRATPTPPAALPTVLGTPRGSPSPSPAPVHRQPNHAGNSAHPAHHPTPPGLTVTPKRSSSTPRRSSPLTGPPLEPAATQIPALTPQRTSSAPRVSSPLAQPPLQTGRPKTPPPEPSTASSLPPRLRPSPARATPHRPTPPSPPVYPMSRPMANAPKKPAVKTTPGTMAKRMAEVRGARKGKAKTGGKARGARRTTTSTVTEEESGGAAAGTVSEVGSGGAAAGTTSGVVAGGVVAAPALIFSSTNNNRNRIQQEDQQRRAREKSAAEAKKERMRLHNPDGESELVIVPPARPRRNIQAPQNKGPVMSLIDKKQAEADAALLAALNKDKTAKTTKRKSESQENHAPSAKKAKSK